MPIFSRRHVGHDPGVVNARIGPKRPYLPRCVFMLGRFFLPLHGRCGDQPEKRSSCGHEELLPDPIPFGPRELPQDEGHGDVEWEE